ncbi:MAG TPA: TVP38/TMEM64 family protein [bacterium]|nr:TVP38/TMEM64 family protein [Candidatus Omnitrophota bacterium]HOL95504.1 TVP38/TMEM64 family protein [bacterium]HPO99284.1 TVP38/TMEM64 family protein [bacterium]
MANALGTGPWLAGLQESIENLGPWGPLVFVLIYVLATTAAIPGTPLSLVAGAVFGSVLGVILVSLASTLGAALCFLIARYFARDATALWLSRNERFQQLDQLTERQGALIVALTRLIPLFPFNLLNYGFGLTRVPFWTYVFVSWLGMLPGTLVYVVSADAAGRSVTEGRIPWPLLIVLAAGLLVLGILIRFAKHRLAAVEK